MPHYLLSDKVFQKRIHVKVIQVVRENGDCDPMQLWDLLKCELHGETIKYMVECSNAKKVKVQDIDNRIAHCTIQKIAMLQILIN